VFTRDQPPGFPGGAVTQGKIMEEPAREPRESTRGAKWSEATGQAILLAGIAWSIFTLTQAHWYGPTFNVRPFDAKWLAVTFVTGAVPSLIVLLLAFLASWLIGAIRGRGDPWRSYRDGLIVAALFTLLINLGMWLGQSQ
jgi:hypothetical protein